MMVENCPTQPTLVVQPIAATTAAAPPQQVHGCCRRATFVRTTMQGNTSQTTNKAMKPTWIVQPIAAAAATAAAPPQQVHGCLGDAAAAALLLRTKEQLGQARGGVGCKAWGGRAIISNNARRYCCSAHR